MLLIPVLNGAISCDTWTLANWVRGGGVLKVSLLRGCNEEVSVVWIKLKKIGRGACEEVDG